MPRANTKSGGHNIDCTKGAAYIYGLRPSSISAKQADLKDMGFVSLFKSACFLFLLRANAARTQTSMHILSYVTRLRSPLLYPFVVLCDLKPLKVSALFGGPLTLGMEDPIHNLELLRHSSKNALFSF